MLQAASIPVIRSGAKLGLIVLLNLPSVGVTAANRELQDTAAAIVRGFDGHWRSHFKIRETPFTTYSERRAEILNRCHQKASVAICVQSVDGAASATMRYEPRTRNNVEVNTMDVHRRSTVAPMEIRGQQWIFLWTEAHGAKTIQYQIVNRFKSSDTIAWSEDARPAGGRWRRVGEGSEQRLSR